MSNTNRSGCNAGHAAPVKIKPNNAPNSIANTIYAVGLLATTFKSIQPNARSMRRFKDFLPYVLENADDGFFIALNDSYKTIGTVARQDHEFLKIPQNGIDASLLLENGYFYRRTHGPFMGRPSHCRAYLFRLWWSFRKLGLPAPMTYAQMIAEAAKVLPTQSLLNEVSRCCHEH